MGQRAMMAPVFLVGCPRSGTTLLQRLLHSHSFIAVTPETHFIRRFWLRRNSFGNPADDVAFGRLVDAVVDMPEFADMHLNAEAFRAAANRVERSIPAVFNLLLRSFAERRNAAIVGEKTPNHLLYMQTLESFFPAARFIHIIRDPRAVVNSWRTVPWSTGSIAGDTAVWRRYMRTAWKLPPASGKLHVMHYEALTSSPDRELRRICAFLQIPFEPGMLSYYEHAAQTLDFTREPWKQNVARPIDARAQDEWRRALTPAQIAEIEQLSWAEMVRLGYQPDSDPGLPLIGAARRAVRRLLTRAG